MLVSTVALHHCGSSNGTRGITLTLPGCHIRSGQRLTVLGRATHMYLYICGEGHTYVSLFLWGGPHICISISVGRATHMYLYICGEGHLIKGLPGEIDHGEIDHGDY